MPARVIHNPLPNEALLGIDPELLSRLEVNWRHRLNLFTGRALTESALDLEQANHAGLLALTGQLVSLGVTQGLRATLELSADGPYCHIQPGSGITIEGDDVNLATPMRAALADVAVAVDGAVLENTTFKEFIQHPASPDFAGVLVLQPVIVSLAEKRDEDDQASFITDSCQADPDRYAFEDWQMLDGCRLVFHAWPKDLLALPPAGPNWRNRVAYAIFDYEAAFEAANFFPWESIGVPIALLGFDPSWKPLFIDRYAVMRTGGYPRRRSTSPNPLDIRVENGEFAPPYNSFLAEARIHQFAEELSETNPGQLVDQFSSLPPVGVVPVGAVNLSDKSNVSFPAHFRIKARPVHANELDGLIAASATSAAIDLTAPEGIELLAPLPDAVYDPRLLITEEVSPEFQDEVSQSRKNRDELLRHRLDLQLKANALLTALALPEIDTKYDVSQDEESPLSAPYTAPADENFATQPRSSGSGALGSSALDAMKSTARSSPYTVPVPIIDDKGSPTDKNKEIALVSETELRGIDNDDEKRNIKHIGLQTFIDTLQHRVDAANDLLDLAFLRAQTDIYRYRQHMLNNVDATRLATSPILAQIAQGTTVNATKDELQKFLDKAKATGQVAAPTAPTSIPSFAQRPRNLMPIFTSGGMSRSITASASIPKPALHPATPAHPAAPIHPAAPPAHPAAPHLLTTAHVSSPVGGVVRKTPAPAHPAPPTHPAAPQAHAVVQPAVLPFAPPTLRFLGAAGGLIPSRPAQAPAAPKGPTPTDIHQDSPIIGAQLNFRTVSVAQRLRDSPSQEALFFATGNRLELTQALSELEITTDDIPLMIDLEGEEEQSATDKSKLEAKPDTGLPSPEIATDKRWTVGDFKSGDKRGQITNRMLAPVMKANPDESHLFSVGVRVLEQHTALLRALEARIQLYHNFILIARDILKNIQDTLTALDARLKQVEDDLDSARHDLAFATALLAEETQRVASINEERAQVLKQCVTYLVFRRPPAIAGTIDLPTRPLDPAIASSPVPTCLSRKTSTPPELHDMLALLREAPVSWIPEMLGLVSRFNRLYLIQQLAATIREHALVRQSAALPAAYAQSQQGALSLAMYQVYARHQTVMISYRNARAYFDPSLLLHETWLTWYGYMQQLASIGDLLDSHYASPAITRAAANLFQQISSVAGCLYERVGAVKPIYRLRWAERLADTTAHADLHDLAVLPTWSELDYVTRRELQAYVDWLFARVQHSIQEAADYVSDLVRVCILLASHAPVDEIIQGEVISPTPKLAVGNIVKVGATSTRLYHGMQVLLYGSKMDLVAHGAVEDLSGAEVAVRIASVLKPGATISTSNHAHFVATPIPLSGVSHPLR